MIISKEPHYANCIAQSYISVRVCVCVSVREDPEISQDDVWRVGDVGERAEAHYLT